VLYVRQKPYCVWGHGDGRKANGCEAVRDKVVCSQTHGVHPCQAVHKLWVAAQHTRRCVLLKVYVSRQDKMVGILVAPWLCPRQMMHPAVLKHACG
jgi:hypothetical protein